MIAFEQSVTFDRPDSKNCPANLRDSLFNYTVHHTPTGSFLRAVLENDLSVALGTADPINLAHLRDIVAHCHENLPAVSWGSKARVAAWLERRP